MHEIEKILVRWEAPGVPARCIMTRTYLLISLSSIVTPIYFHRQPTDIKETVKYTQGLKLTESNSISTKTGLSLELERSVSKGPISGSMKTTLSFELGTVNTWGKESTWSREVT